MEDAFANVVPRMFVSLLELAALVDEFLIRFREGQVLQFAAEHRLRLLPFGHFHRVEAMLAAGDPAEAADEIHIVGALH